MSRQRYICFDPSTGKIIHTVYYQKEDLPESAKSVHLVVDADLVTEDYYVCDGVLVKKPDKPTLHHTFDYTTKKWVDLRTLEDVKAAQWAAIKKARDDAELGGFTWDSSVFDSDTVSQGRIQGAVQLASITPGFEIAWTLADNSIRVLSRTDMEAVGVAMGIHIGIQHAKARELRPLIYAAQTMEEVLAVVW